MFARLFFLFLTIPLVELYVLIAIGKEIGAVNTIVVVILTAFVGAALARHQGLKTMMNVHVMIQQGVMPTYDIIQGFLILIAGMVLLTPGFITDLFGLLLLIPITRKLTADYLISKIGNHLKKSSSKTIYYHHDE